MRSSRNYEIDILRGIGILAIIIIHVNAYFLGNSTAKLLWDYSQFTVQTFVFCAGYIFFSNKKQLSLRTFPSYFLKRVKRLILPYYLFLFLYFFFIWLSDPKSLNIAYLIRQLTLTTPGNELNWFVVLFLQFAVLIPILSWWGEKRKVFFHLYSLFALGFSLFLLSSQVPINYKLTMWLPWSLILILSWYTARLEDRNWFYPITITVTFLTFYFLRLALQLWGRSLTFYDNKYPPNLYFTSYGILITLLLMLSAQKGVFKGSIVKKTLTFLGVNSYSIFFIHFLLIFSFAHFLNFALYSWWQVFLVIFVLTVILQLSINKISASRH